jgi:hypothetical protein
VTGHDCVALMRRSACERWGWTKNVRLRFLVAQPGHQYASA